jgi:hypothetical protein
MKAVWVVTVGCVLFGCALFGMSAEKMRVTTVCHDARLYMDGGIDMTIESGGLNFHRVMNVYRKHLNDEVLVGTISVAGEVHERGAEESYMANGLRLTISKDQAPGRYGFPSRFRGLLKGEPVDVAMNCARK